MSFGGCFSSILRDELRNLRYPLCTKRKWCPCLPDVKTLRMWVGLLVCNNLGNLDLRVGLASPFRADLSRLPALEIAEMTGWPCNSNDGSATNSTTRSVRAKIDAETSASMDFSGVAWGNFSFHPKSFFDASRPLTDSQASRLKPGATDAAAWWLLLLERSSHAVRPSLA
jgi:hypothetical protein